MSGHNVDAMPLEKALPSETTVKIYIPYVHHALYYSNRKRFPDEFLDENSLCIVPAKNESDDYIFHTV